MLWGFNVPGMRNFLVPDEFGHDARRGGSTPALDKRISPAALHAIDEEAIDRQRSRTGDAEIVAPGRQHHRVELLAFRERHEIDFCRLAPYLIHRGEILRRFGKAFAAWRRVLGARLEVSQQQLRAPGRL